MLPGLRKFSGTDVKEPDNLPVAGPDYTSRMTAAAGSLELRRHRPAESKGASKLDEVPGVPEYDLGHPKQALWAEAIRSCRDMTAAEMEIALIDPDPEVRTSAACLPT